MLAASHSSRGRGKGVRAPMFLREPEVAPLGAMVLRDPRRYTARRSRTTRRTIAAVAVAASVLAPASALAECAWVLWQNTVSRGASDGAGLREWRIGEVTETRQACDAELQRTVKIYRDSPPSGWTTM